MIQFSRDRLKVCLKTLKSNAQAFWTEVQTEKSSKSVMIFYCNGTELVTTKSGSMTNIYAMTSQS